MFCRKFELILIKFDFLRIFKVALKSDQRPCTIVQGLGPKMARREFYITFSDSYMLYVYYFIYFRLH